MGRLTSLGRRQEFSDSPTLGRGIRTAALSHGLGPGNLGEILAAAAPAAFGLTNKAQYECQLTYRSVISSEPSVSLVPN